MAFYQNYRSLSKQLLLVIGFIVFTMLWIHAQNWNPTGTTSLEIGRARPIDFLQDQYGFIWIASDKGLWKYDGVQTQNYNTSTFKELPGNYTVCIEEIASRNEIWIGTHNGLGVYDFKTNQIRNFVFDSSENNLGFGVQNIVLIDNQVWILGKDLVRFDLNNETRQKIELNDIKNSSNSWMSYLSRISRSIIQDSENPNYYWVGTNFGLVHLDQRTNSYQRYIYNQTNEVHLRGFNQQIFLYPLTSKEIFYQTYSWGSFIFDKEKKVFHATGIDRNFMDNNTGRSTIARLQKMDESALNITLKNGKTIFYNINTQKVSLAASAKVPKFIDKDSICYFAKPGKIEIVMPRLKGIKHYPLPGQMKWPNSLVDLFEDSLRNQLFCLNSGKGLYRLDLETGGWTRYESPVDLKSHGYFGLNHFLFLNSDSVLLLGHNQIWLLDLVNNEISATDTHDPINDYLTQIMRDHDGNIWISSRDKGLSRWTSGGILPAFGADLNRKDPYHGTSVYKLLIDNNNNLWIRTRTGHTVIELKKKQTHNYPYSFTPDSTFLGINDILEDDRGNIWVSSDDGLGIKPSSSPGFGLRKLLISKSLSNYKKLGLMDFDSQGNLWMSTDQDILCFNFADSSIQNIPLIGFQSNNQYSEMRRISQGKMAYGVDDGILIFSPSEIKSGGHFNHPYLKSVHSKDLPAYTGTNWFFPQTANFPSSTKQLTIEYSAVSYLNYPNMRFSYYLTGVDDNWKFTENQHVVSYSNLKGGEYIFKLRSMDQSGTWSDELAWTFIIATPFYQTSLFKFLLTGIFLTGIFAIYKININKIKEKEKRNTSINKRLAQLEMRALKAKMNPHFIFNSLNSIQSLITKGDDRSSLIYLNKFGKLIREVLENSEKSRIPLAEELNILEKYIQLEALRFENQFSYSIETDEKLDTNEIIVPNLLLQPYVENAIHHGLVPKDYDGKLTISVSENNGLLQFDIADNGIGRQASQKHKNDNHVHKSLGMQVTRERIELASKGKVENPVEIIDLRENGTALGTKVIIRIPKEEI